jgi:hypothetical protein
LIPINAQPNTNVYFCNEGYGLIKFKTDKFGFRNKNEIWEQNNLLQNNKIVIIGDSFGQGACVKEKSMILNNQSKYTIYNLSSGGNSPYIYTSLIQTFVPYIKPKVLILVFFANDKDDEGAEIFKKNINNENFSQKYIVNNNLSSEVLHGIQGVRNLIASTNPTRNLKKKTSTEIMLALKLTKTRFIVKNYFKKFFFTLPESSQLAINTLDQYCSSYNCKPIIVYIPNSKFWNPDAESEIYKDLLTKFILEKKITFIDMSNVFSKHSEKDIYSKKGGHLSPFGYNLVSNSILKIFSVHKSSQLSY